MRLTKLVVPAAAAAMFVTVSAAPALADNPHSMSSPTGQPSQSCQSYSPTTRPGNSYQSPGSPFNEMGINSTNGGNGGNHYSESSQYDVACFQQAQHA